MKKIFLCLCGLILMSSCAKKDKKVKIESSTYTDSLKSDANSNSIEKWAKNTQKSTEDLSEQSNTVLTAVKDIATVMDKHPSISTIYTLEIALEKMQSTDSKEQYLASVSLQGYEVSNQLSILINQSKNKQVILNQLVQKAFEHAHQYQRSLRQKTKKWISQYRETHVKRILQKNHHLRFPKFNQQHMNTVQACDHNKLRGLLKKYDYEYIQNRIGATIIATEEDLEDRIKLIKELKDVLITLNDDLSKELLGVVEAKLFIYNRMDISQVIRNNNIRAQQTYERIANKANLQISDVKKQVRALYNEMPACFDIPQFFSSFKVIKDEETLLRGKRLIPYITKYYKNKGTLPPKMDYLCDFIKKVGKDRQNLFDCRDAYRHQYQIVSNHNENVLWSIGEDTMMSTKDDIKIGLIPHILPNAKKLEEGVKEGVKEISAGQYIIDRVILNKELNDLDNLIRQVRVIPHYAKGKPSGFKIIRISPNSIFHYLGLQSGDVIKSVGGEKLNSINKALGLFDTLQVSNKVLLNFDRKGTINSVEYTIK